MNRSGTRCVRLFVVGVLSLIAAASTSSAQEQVTLGYDDLGRLTSVCHVNSGQLDAYQYDPAGNRSSVTATANVCQPPALAISNAAAKTEGQTLVFTVNRTGNLSQSQSIDYVASAGSAGTGDFTAVSGTLTFAANEASKGISVPTIDDSIYENAETVLVNISNPTGGALITDSQGSGTINNNDAAPSFAISNASAAAGSPLSFTVTKTGSTGLSHSVNYATANGTAIAGTHYTTKSGTLTFTSGQTSQTISVTTTSGSVTSGSMAMVVNLSAATNNATIADNQGSGTINAPPPNNPPVAVNDTVNGTYQVFDSVNVYVRTNDSDPDGDPLTVTAASCVSGGCQVSVAAGGTHISVTGTTMGNKTVNYTISDGKGGTDSATATVGYFEDSCALC